MPPPRAEKQKAERRSQILDAAETLFTRKGYDNTAVSDIVRAAGIAQGTFYLYFSSKESVLVALIEQFFSEVLGKVILAVITEKSPLLRIEKAVALLFEEVAKKREMVSIIHTGAALATASRPEYAIAQTERICEPLAAWISEGIELGEIRLQDPKLAAYLITVLVHEFIHHTLLLNYPAPAKEKLPEVLAFIKQALKA